MSSGAAQAPAAADADADADADAVAAADNNAAAAPDAGAANASAPPPLPPPPVLDPVAGAYEKLHRVGEGTYGVVYKARHLRTGRVVALKRVRFDERAARGEGLPVTSARELRVLQRCGGHPNIVRLERVVTGARADSVFLVFEYAPHDLGRLLDALPAPFTESEVKCLARQLLAALAHLHAKGVAHRDVKPSNLLYGDDGVLKLCDFGLARHAVRPGEPVTPRVVTLWYRAPEVLLGARHYDEAIDCWAAGCVLGELLRHAPLFPATSEVECLQMHARLLGPPDRRTWPGLADIPGAVAATAALPANWRGGADARARLRGAFPALSRAGVELLAGLLEYDPARRLTAAGALRSPYFAERPYPKPARDMPSFPSTHEPGFRGALRPDRHGGGGGGGRYDSPPRSGDLGGGGGGGDDDGWQTEQTEQRQQQHASDPPWRREAQRAAGGGSRDGGAYGDGARWAQAFDDDRGGKRPRQP